MPKLNISSLYNKENRNRVLNSMKTLNKIAIAIAMLPLIFSAACAPKAKEESPQQVSANAAANLKTSDDFLIKNKSQTGVITTKSGLQYTVVNSGPKSGVTPGYTSIVRVNYEGKLLDGTIFDSSYQRGQAAEFPVDGLIPAWVEALQLMRPGDEWTIWVHPNLGYGDLGMPAGCERFKMQCQIPPNSLLVFKMRLESVVGSGAAAVDIPATETNAANDGHGEIK